MSKEAFIKTTTDLMTAVDEAFKKEAPLPAFILLYSSVDILASLTRPITSDDTTGAIFKDWVTKYMIGSSSFVWTADDIWGARCGLLHTYTVQSRSSREGNAREMHYISDREFTEHVQKKLDPNAEDKVFVCLPDLIVAFIDGVEAFARDVVADLDLQKRVLHHAEKLIIHERKDIT